MKLASRCGAAIAIAAILAIAARAPSLRAEPPTGSGFPDYGMPVMDNQVYGHLLFDQLEGRTNGPDQELRWDGEGWIGTDFNRLWIKSEGFYNQQGKVEDGIHEVLYDRPITRYFDVQGGLRYDLDSDPQRFWGALGIEGLAPEFFNFEATAYARDAGHFAARIVGYYDLRLLQRLVAQPECELNFYSKEDSARGIGTGLSEIDTGLRIRYELDRKLAPYVGIAYNQKFGETADFTQADGLIVRDLRFVFGIRVWY